MGTDQGAAELRGISLRRRLKEQGPLSLEDASKLVDQIAEAVDLLHERGHRHGAISPDNIWIMLDGQYKLYTNHHVSNHASSHVSLHVSHPATGGIASLQSGYVTPEEARGESPTRAADIWAMGALLYEVLTGRAALSGVEPLKGEGACAQPVLDRALTESPLHRYHSAQQLANALWECLPHPAPDASHPRRSSTKAPEETDGLLGLHECVNRPLNLSSSPSTPKRQTGMFTRLRTRRDPPARHVVLPWRPQLAGLLDAGFPGRKRSVAEDLRAV